MHAMSFTRRLLAFLLLSLSPALVLPADRAPAVPSPFEQLVPSTLGDGLALVALRKRCEDCVPWRELAFVSDTPSTPARQEKVSVHAGLTAMYAYPGTDHFANVKVEQSMPGMFEQDKAVVIRALEHHFRYVQARIASHLAADPAARARLGALLAPGKEAVEFERRTVQGIEYVSHTDRVIGLTGGTISQIHFFVPGRDIIVTAYLLNQKRARFANIEEFLRLRADFIRAWVDLLSREAQPRPAS